jgi:BRCT domain type II-containing protein
VVGAEPGASKVTKAESLGIPVLDEVGFIELLETGALPAQTLPAQTLPAQTLPAQTLPAQTT